MTVIVWHEITSVYVALVPVQPFASVTVTTIGNVPGAEGEPERTPAADRVSPTGSVEDVVKIAGVCVPTPVWVNVWLNGASTVPVVVPGFVTVIVWHEITSVYVALVPVQPFASVTLTTIGNVPFCPGVPESVPSAASVRPLGSVEDVVNVAVPTAPVWVNVWLNGASTVPAVTPGFVIVIVGQTVTRL